MPRKYRLNNKKIIEHCAIKGKKFYTNSLICKYMPSTNLQIAIIVSKKYNVKANKRNKIRRRIRSIIYKNLLHIKAGYWLIIVKNNLSDIQYLNLEKELQSVLC